MIFLRLSRREREGDMTGSMEGNGTGNQRQPPSRSNAAMMSSPHSTRVVILSSQPLPHCPRIWELVEYTTGQ